MNTTIDRVILHYLLMQIGMSLVTLGLLMMCEPGTDLRMLAWGVHSAVCGYWMAFWIHRTRL